MANTGFTPERVAKIINETFSPPFVEEGLVKAHVTEKHGDFVLKVGRRDVQIGPDGNWVAQGTDVR